MLVITSTRGYPFKGSVHFRHSSEPGNRWLFFSLGEDGGHQPSDFRVPYLQTNTFQDPQKSLTVSANESPPLPESCCFRCLPLLRLNWLRMFDQIHELMRGLKWLYLL